MEEKSNGEREIKILLPSFLFSSLIFAAHKNSPLSPDSGKIYAIIDKISAEKSANSNIDIVK